MQNDVNWRIIWRPQQPVQVPFCVFVYKKQPVVQDQPVMAQANTVLTLLYAK